MRGDFGNPTVIIYMTHFIDDIVIGEYRKLKAEAGPGYDVKLVYNSTISFLPVAVPPDVDLFRFDIRDLGTVSYPNKKPVLAAHNVDSFVINFARRHPEYSYYWVVEYDIRFSGHWRTLLDAFALNDADLLGTTIYRYSRNPDWTNWPSLIAPVPLTPDEKICAFIPIYRISARALAALEQGYRDGWGGHFECALPSILYQAGLRLEDMGGDGEFVARGNHNRFYRNFLRGKGYGPGTMVFQPARPTAGDEPDMLWHPVKTIRGLGTRRRELALRKMVMLLKYGPAVLAD